jgi:hypothetical protein
MQLSSEERMRSELHLLQTRHKEEEEEEEEEEQRLKNKKQK